MVRDMFDYEEFLNEMLSYDAFSFEKKYQYNHTSYHFICEDKHYEIVYYVDGGRQNHIEVSSIYFRIYGTRYGTFIDKTHPMVRNFVYEMFGI